MGEHSFDPDYLRAFIPAYLTTFGGGNGPLTAPPGEKLQPPLALLQGDLDAVRDLTHGEEYRALSSAIALFGEYRAHFESLGVCNDQILDYLCAQRAVLEQLYTTARESVPSPTRLLQPVHQYATDARRPSGRMMFRNENGRWEFGECPPTGTVFTVAGPPETYQPVTVPYAAGLLDAVYQTPPRASAIIAHIEAMFSGPPCAPNAVTLTEVGRQTGDAKLLTECPVNVPAAPPGPYDALRELIDALGLKGNEREVVLAICEGDGSVPIATLGLRLGWNNTSGNWNNTRQRLDKKFRRRGWRFRTHDNRAVAVPVPLHTGRN